jgi:hypothetical protein
MTDTPFAACLKIGQDTAYDLFMTISIDVMEKDASV